MSKEELRNLEAKEGQAEEEANCENASTTSLSDLSGTA